MIHHPKFRAFIPTIRTMIYEVDVYASGMIGINTFNLVLPGMCIDWSNRCIIEDLPEDVWEEGKPLCQILTGEDYIWFEPGTFELMQWTGLKDCADTDIYEGDMYKSWYSRDMSGKDIIQFEDVVELELIFERSGFYIPFLNNAVVTGNIHEHSARISHK